MESLGNEFFSIIETRWIEVNQDLAVWGESDIGICLGVDRVRQIGEQFNRIGGLSMLMAVRAEIAERCREFSPDLEYAFNAEIAHAWKGIDGWQA